jgi:peptidoglycan hydrolase CwlO-like protein
MRSKLLTVAIAAGLGLTSFAALAATPKSQQPAGVTVDAATLQQLQAQLAALQAQVADLQAKQEARANA